MPFVKDDNLALEVYFQCLTCARIDRVVVRTEDSLTVCAT